MRVFGLAGWSGSGKTTLVCRLLPQLIDRGLTVSTIKHAHHKFDVDKPGKDSHRHREAGAREVMVGSGLRWALMHELRDEPEPGLDQLLAHMSPVDLVIVEGFKTYPGPKMEVYRQVTGKPLLYPGDPNIVAIASDTALPEADRPVLPIEDISAIADFICDHAGLRLQVSAAGAT